VAAAPGPTPIHVGDLDGSAIRKGRNWTARVTIRIDDGDHAAVAGVVVSGSWSAGASGGSSCTTGAAGTCTVQKAKLSTTVAASVTFTVTGVTATGRTYAAASNHDPDGDSTGTSILVLRPT
jgi:hypothetical protein